MRRFGEYDHLNQEDPLKIKLDLDQLAKMVEGMNYGSIRFLAALVRAMEVSKHRQQYPEDTMKLPKAIREILDTGIC